MDKNICPICLKPMKKVYNVYECKCGAIVDKDGKVVYSPEDRKPVIGEPK
jgi:hypothetical protein